MTTPARGLTVRPLDPASPAYAEATRLRYDALYREWGLPRSLTDDANAAAFYHIGVFDADAIVGYARIDLALDEPQIYQVSVARDRRGEGIGALLVEVLKGIAAQAGHTEVWLDARAHVIPFYERLGFEVVGEEFLSRRTATPHRRMRAPLGGDADAPLGG